MIRAGDYRHQVRIEQRVTTQDAAGEPQHTWTVFATVRAALQRTPGRELVTAAQVEARVPTIFRIRWLAGVTPAMRIVHDSKVYELLSVVDQAGLHEELVISAEERVESSA